MAKITTNQLHIMARNCPALTVGQAVALIELREARYGGFSDQQWYINNLHTHMDEVNRQFGLQPAFTPTLEPAE